MLAQENDLVLIRLTDRFLCFDNNSQITSQSVVCFGAMKSVTLSSKGLLLLAVKGIFIGLIFSPKMLPMEFHKSTYVSLSAIYIWY